MPNVTSRDGTSIAYDKVGSGPALIHVGAAIQHRAIDPGLAELSRQLADDFTVIVYDRRGRGESGDAPDYEVEREFEDIEALMGLVGGVASLIGYSSGAVLAAEAALAGLPVQKLALYEPPFAFPDARDPWPLDYVETLDRFIAAGDRDGAAQYFFTAGVGVPSEHVAAMRASPFWGVVSDVAPTLRYDARIVTRGYAGGAMAERWSRIATPTIVIGGEATVGEFPYIARSVDAVAAAIPNSARSTLAGQGHGPAAEAIAPVLAAFLAA